MARPIAAWLLTGLAMSAAPAMAADTCTKPLRMLTSLPMTPRGDGGVVTVPVSINGAEKQFVLDTGGMLMQVSTRVADELKLPRYDSTLVIFAVDGSKSDKYTKIDSFAMGKLPASPARMQISPIKDIDGILSPMIFKSLDFDMDFAAHKLNLMLADHCEGKVIYWPAKAVAVVPFTLRDNHITVPVTVDGHALTAIIDTGASTSVVRQNVARYILDIAPDSPDLKIIDHLGNDEKAPIYTYPFKTLSFEGIAVNNSRINILTDIVNKQAAHDGNNGRATGSHLKGEYDDLTLPEVIIGMDVLSRLHPYLALTEGRLYLTEANIPAAAAPAP